ncbi:MAG: SDR family NAD(P)-dependent oxidoreductase [Pseudomonadota bacterium]
MIPRYRHALIIGAGSGLSAALARRFAGEGLAVSLAARDTTKLASLVSEIGAAAFRCDAGQRSSIATLFEALDQSPAGAPDVLVYNPSARQRGRLLELDPEAVARAVEITALGAFHAAQEAARRMLPATGGDGLGNGALLFTGASAGVKGFAQSAPFAMGKFALRGLAQSLARELHPRGVHVGHFVIDGGIRNVARADRIEPADRPDSMLDPTAIADTYWHFLCQDRSAWAWEIEVRPWVERF